jgi:hypothetical protein
MASIRYGWGNKPGDVSEMELDPETGVVIVRWSLDEVVERIPWVLNPQLEEWSMPVHKYVVYRKCPVDLFVTLLFAVRTHPKSYMAYFRGYQTPTRYLEFGGNRYWESWGGSTQMLNTCTPDSVEPPRRVDQGARPIPPEEWRARRYNKQGSGWQRPGEPYRAEPLPNEHRVRSTAQPRFPEFVRVQEFVRSCMFLAHYSAARRGPSHG